MNAVVFGEKGQLASHLRELLPSARFLGTSQLDLRAPENLFERLAPLGPTVLINAAAYTSVDRAEQERETAWQLNADAPAHMAIAATKLDIPLVHISTDYVFGGRKAEPWLVTDTCDPVNAYGSTKLAGEIAVRTLASRHWILRTSWVFSEHGSNFVKTILRLAHERPELRVVDDQYGVPTDALDLARIAAAISQQPLANPALPYGTYHAVGGPPISWCGFAEQIVRGAMNVGALPREVPVRGIRTHDFPTAAVRPANSVLARSIELDRLLERSMDWQVGLVRVLQYLSADHGQSPGR